MHYDAKVLDATMRVQTMRVEAGSVNEAMHVIASAGFKLIELRQRSYRPSLPSRTSSFNLPVFNQQLHSLLTAGQSITDAIDMLGRNDEAGRHRATYSALLQGLRQGKQLSEAMAALPSVFPSLFVAMIRASETTGTTRSAISRYMEYQRQVDQIRRKLASAAVYPAILLIVGFAVISFLMLYVVPRFSVVFDEASSHAQDGHAFVQIWGGFVRENTILAWSMFLGAAGTVLTAVFHPAPRAWLSRRILQLPWLGENLRILQLARLYRTIAMLLRSGVSVLPALNMTKGSLPVAMQLSIDAVTTGVSEGRPLSSVMAEQGLSTEVAQRLTVAGESSGNLKGMMEHIADFYDQEIAAWIDTSSRMVEPILMVGIGLVIGAIVLMLYSPIFDLANVS